MLIEVCVDSVESAVAAQRGGADRVELCAALLEGGLTPSLGTIRVAREHLKLKLHVIIRPRGGDFLYSESEFQTMLIDIDAAKRAGADGVVTGVLEPNGEIDAARTRELAERARPMSVTFHRAFDVCRDPIEALHRLRSLPIDRLLTSGQESSALAGLELIAQLVSQAGDALVIMPGVGIDARNIRKIAETTGAVEFHVTGTASEESGMTHRNPRVFMGGELRPPEYRRDVTNSRAIEQIVNNVRP